jgi:polysaccharide biosynthesis protein
MIKKIKSLKSNNEFMKYFNNTSYLFFDKIFKMVISFFVVIYLTRYLGPERFGLLSYAQSFVSIFVAFASLGLSQIIVRDIVNDQNNVDKVLGTAFFMMFASSIISMGVIFVLSFFIYKESQTRLLVNIVAITVIFQVFYILIESFFQARVLSKYIVLTSNTGFVFSSSIKILLVYFSMPLMYFAYALAFDSLFLALGCLFIYNYKGGNILGWKFEKSLLKKYIKISIPMLMVSVTAFIYTRTDQIMIKHMLGDDANGNYAAAIRVSELFYFIPGVIVASIYPKLVELKLQNQDNYLKLLEKLYRLVLWISIPIALTMTFCSSLIITILYGEKFISAPHILSILSWCIIFSSIDAVFVKILYVENFESRYLYKNVFGVLINIVLNYILINTHGAVGAAMATLITLMCVSYVFDLLDPELRRYYYLKVVCWVPYRYIK